jgi:hypothetical protein
MGQLPTEIESLINAEKILGGTPNWDYDSDSKYVVFSYPLEIEGITTGGFQLRLKVSKRWPDRDCIAQLEYAPTRRTAFPLWRVDWRPLSPHTNTGTSKEYPFVKFTDSHHHPFDENFFALELRMRAGNLPNARPLLNDLNTLSDFLACVGELFRIKDINRVEIPSVSADMFWTFL